ncbi:MAG: SDR family oxidoreductase [Sulfolobales archaeon]|nr:SDR family oxidoreductase [Sulfolobales archaeon]MCX8186485.1 SDR family oxidoreductase [Sulfolobales archaeon]
MKLADRVALVTGGARGIGKSIAELFLREGAKVIIIDVLDDELAKVREELGRFGEIMAVKADIRRREEVIKVLKDAVERYGRIDILVNNAGIFSTSSIEDLTEEQWDKVMSVNLKAAVFLCKEVVEYMKRQGYGKIINMSSLAAHVGGIFAGVDYAVSKAGLICLTKSLARRLAKYNILVNAVAPGVIESPMTAPWPEEIKRGFIQKVPLGRLGKPEDVAKVVLFLASDDSNYMTGQVINVDGGMSIGP